MHLSVFRRALGVLTFLAVAGTGSISMANSTTADVELTYNYWMPTITASSGPAVVGGGISVSSVDAKKTLGIQDKNLSDVQLSWSNNDKSKWQLDYFKSNFHGTAAPTIQIGGWNFSGGTFNSDVDARNVQLAWTKYLNEFSDDDTRYGYVAGLRNVKISAHSIRTDGAVKFEKDFNFIFPTLGFTVETGRNNPVSAFANLAGAYAGSKGYFYDGDAGVKTFLNDKRTASLTAGYRLLKVYGKKGNGDMIDAKLSGPYFAAEVKF